MEIGDKVWIFDSNSRKYYDDKGNRTSSPWYRGYFNERYIIGETSQSWIVGYYQNASMDNRNNLKVNKKTLKYSNTNMYGLDGKLYTSEEEIKKLCWLNDNHYKISQMIERCKDYDKLKKIEKILMEE
jgi:hypothetical protein